MYFVNKVLRRFFSKYLRPMFCQLRSLPHGLINYADTKAFVGFSSKLTCRKIFRHKFAILETNSVDQTQLFSWGGNFNVGSG
jgi:hypothetical protein